MNPKKLTILYWIFTILFALLMLFSAAGGLQPSEGAIKIMHDGMGYPVYFIQFISIAKLLGSIAILVPGFNKIKEWAYAGFAINLGSALIAHRAVGDGPAAWGWAAGTAVLWGLSYFFWRHLQVTQASA